MRARIDQEPHILDLVLSNEAGMDSDIKYCTPLDKNGNSLITLNLNCYIQQENTERLKYYYDKSWLSRHEINWADELEGKDIINGFYLKKKHI